MSGKTVVIVDDEPAMVDMLTTFLTMKGFQVHGAYTGMAGLDAIEREQPDVVLLDLMLPDHDGWEITRWMRREPLLQQTPVIMLTARVSDTDKIVGLELGADDYVTKPYNPREVVARVRARLRARAGMQMDDPGRILRVAELQMDLATRQVLVQGKPVVLTVTEFEILRALMEQSGYVLTRGDLVRKALGSDFQGLERTLDSHMRNLRAKIEPDPRTPRYIKTVYGVGYILEEGKTA